MSINTIQLLDLLGDALKIVAAKAMATGTEPPEKAKEKPAKKAKEKAPEPTAPEPTAPEPEPEPEATEPEATEPEDVEAQRLDALRDACKELITKLVPIDRAIVVEILKDYNAPKYYDNPALRNVPDEDLQNLKAHLEGVLASLEEATDE